MPFVRKIHSWEQFWFFYLKKKWNLSILALAGNGRWNQKFIHFWLFFIKFHYKDHFPYVFLDAEIKSGIKTTIKLQSLVKNSDLENCTLFYTLTFIRTFWGTKTSVTFELSKIEFWRLYDFYSLFFKESNDIYHFALRQFWFFLKLEPFIWATLLANSLSVFFF